MAKFFPEGRALTAQIEEQLWDELIGLGRDASPTIFDDQYICSGGSFYELLAGHDRMIGDLRPLVLPRSIWTRHWLAIPTMCARRSSCPKPEWSTNILWGGFRTPRSTPRARSPGSAMPTQLSPSWRVPCSGGFLKDAFNTQVKST